MREMKVDGQGFNRLERRENIYPQTCSNLFLKGCGNDGSRRFISIYNGPHGKGDPAILRQCLPCSTLL